MPDRIEQCAAGAAGTRGGAARGAGEPLPWVPPSFEVISLDCEITSYAPDGELPLF
jgi:hypothetical protein